MEEQSGNAKDLPENAYKELPPGTDYRPILDPASSPPEVTRWSVFWGVFMAILFSAAAAYSGLKIGQVFEAAIPIAILAVGLSATAKTKGALGQNVIIQSIGASSGVIVAGAIFTIPALYILDLPANFFQVFFASALGGFLGILFLIPFRKYFVKDMHGKLPFPEATATTEILVAGEKGGRQAAVLIIAGLIGGLFDFAFSLFGTWSEVISSRMFALGATVAEKFKLVFRLNVSAMVFGLGYIVGLKYSAIIAAGSFLSWFVLVPLFAEVGQSLTAPLGTSATKLISAMSAEEIFRNYVRQIGIGGIAMAGLIGIIRSSRVIGGAFALAYREIVHAKASAADAGLRTQTDIRMLFNILLILLCALLVFVFFFSGVVFNFTHALVGLLIVIVVSFLFTTVAANATAIVGTNPVSGMTLMTLILSSIVLNQVGLTGSSGIVSALIIGGVVCTALSVAGGFITDLKIGYWIGTTPRKQETWKFLGVIVSAATVGGVILILNQTYGFKGEHAMVAPQANAMAAVIQPLMSNAAAPWVLYVVGAIIALILTMVGIPPLAFALGMYIPQELNTPLLAGGIVAWLVTTRSKNEKLNNARFSRGTLIASGFIAGGALFGVFVAFLKFLDQFLQMGVNNWYLTSWEAQYGEAAGLVMFLALAAYTVWHTMRAREE
ncbi:MAG TPA: oligopeptide transporter, OPT family [Bacteroidota bacterium]|nr:oligopeptide transporter, OPT family [Bacteroidota bacterium]